jgi:hypothetical protein
MYLLIILLIILIYLYKVKSSTSRNPFKVGDTVINTLKLCPHRGSIGIVIDRDNEYVIYKVLNDGNTFKKGDILTKNYWQLEKL